ncbi:endolytic transglycosylase MltG [Rhodovulum sp. 12E13]|uniref:endolytic transglycosylase MltG n=1 Tax=Rhodovulum sp. 12E13 TaxID=2203891 RepID=UPI000E1A8B3A|nr:endolytic transglycosylase MltG [Rhodovulum sp. 12E13]RDC74578.1 endolytic transglycosylase MltG [Rhodovulum sp. 12E13]
MARALASNALTLLIPLLLALAGILAWGQAQYRGPGPLAQAICVEVAPGSTMSQVSRQLAEQGAISNPTLFRLGADYTERSGLLKAGSFMVEPGASMEEIVAAITESGRSTCGTEVNFRIGVTTAEVLVRELDPATQTFEEVVRFTPADEEPPAAYLAELEQPGTRFRVTLAEGVTSWQVVESLRALDLLSGGVEEIPAEGSLAPDSYEVRPGDDKAALIAEMQARQERILSDLWAARQDGLPLESPEEALILASIVEKETAQPEERPLVASVFVNRLRDGMRLQTDPTVIYGVTEGRGTLGRGLRQSELRAATPWNTYVIEGLPPTPIANPGRESIAATLNPVESDYIFFVADGTGGHAFAVTLAEHNENVARWRVIEAERREAAGE